MSYLFNGTTQYLANLSTCPLSNTRPNSVIAWVKNGLATPNGSYIAGVNADLHMFSAAVDQQYDCTVANVRGPSGSSGNASGGTLSKDNVWFMAHGRWPASAGAAKAGWDGANEGSGTNGTESPTNALTETYVAVQKSSGGSFEGYFSGYISMIAVYSIDLSSQQLSELLTTVPSAHSSTYSSCTAFYDFRTNDANILKNKKNPGTYDLTAYNSPTYYADDPSFGTPIADLRLTVAPSTSPTSKIYMTWET